MERIDTLVVGAGVVGLACARALAMAGREVLVVERHALIGSETSARNSEVIHAGIYYPPGSLKARLCVAGRDALYAYCGERAIAHRRCGKLLVATESAQVAKLRALMENGRQNGVTDLHWLDTEAARALEPALRCIAAVHSPSTGIIDSHGLMQSLQADIEARGGMVVLNTPVLGLRCAGDGFVAACGGAMPTVLHARRVVNAAGHGAPALAAATEGLAAAHVPTAHYAKGNYFALAGRSPFERLVYPLPETGGTGIHLTLDLAGAARFGPDVEWVTALDQPALQVTAARRSHFETEIRRYWPQLPEGVLVPSYAGVRPKLGGPAVVSDFRIDGTDVHGIDGLVNLFGIESPGLTSSLAIGHWVRDLLA